MTLEISLHWNMKKLKLPNYLSAGSATIVRVLLAMALWGPVDFNKY